MSPRAHVQRSCLYLAEVGLPRLGESPPELDIEPPETGGYERLEHHYMRWGKA